MEKLLQVTLFFRLWAFFPAKYFFSFAALILISCSPFPLLLFCSPTYIKLHFQLQSQCGKWYLFCFSLAKREKSFFFSFAHLRLLKIPKWIHVVLPPPRHIPHFSHLSRILLHLPARYFQQQPLAQHIQRIDNGQRRLVPLRHGILILQRDKREREIF